MDTEFNTGSNDNMVIKNNSFIIGIGTSAGGLEALKRFFVNLPSNFNHTIVIVQHLSPDYESLMADLLSKSTSLPIHEVKNATIIKPSNVYLIPPKKNMTLKKGVLYLTDKPKGLNLNLPIDIFFKSLAEDKKEHAIGIILSGTGSDGTRGIRVIKEMGGIIMVQKPSDAKFDGMPNSAIATGLVDYILPVSDISSELDNFIKHPNSFNSLLEDDNFLFNKEFNQLVSLVYKKTNIDFSDYKLPTLVRRVIRRMNVNKSKTIKEYLNYIINNDSELEVLYKEFLIGVTRFFRDREAFEILETKVIPELFKNKKANDVIKIWSVACSTGEEAYSIAILIAEYMEKHNINNIDVRIFATDLDKDAIKKAYLGSFTESIVADVSIDHLKKYFVKNGKLYSVVPEIRKLIIFSQHNVAQDTPFTKMDLITCRNLLIYLQPNLQQKIIGNFHYSLKPNRFLFLGPSEAIGDFTKSLKVISRKWRIYENLVPTKSLNLGYFSNNFTSNIYQSQQRNSTKTIVDKQLAETLSQTLLDETGAASAYVDKDYELISADGEFNKYFIFPEKKLRSFNIFKILPQPISLALNTALRKAEKEMKKVVYKDISVNINNSLVTITLIVKPVKTSPTSLNNIYLILFLSEKNENNFKTAANKESFLVTNNVLSSSENDRLILLEQELLDTKANLQAMVEEVETSNEELQATNEELLASNEELQSTNEELQSVNEELHTVNSEFQEKIEEIAIINSDLENLIKSTEIGTIFLDDKLCIRRITPAVKKFFNIIDNDLGRPISHFNLSFGNVDRNSFITNLSKVLSSGKTYQKEIKYQDKWFLKRTNPFYNAKNQIKGAVISFVEITEQKLLEKQFADKNYFLERIINVTPNIIYIFNQETYENEFSNNELSTILGYSVEDVQEMGQDFLPKTMHPEDLERVVRHHENLKNSKIGEVLEFTYRLKDKSGNQKWFLSRDSVFERNELTGGVKHIGVAIDITDLKESQEILRTVNENLELEVDKRTKELQRAEKKYHKLYDNAPDMFVSVSAEDGFIEECNQTLIDKTGFTREEIIGMPILDFYCESSRKDALNAFESFKKTGYVTNKELKIRKKSGDYIDVNLNVSSVKDEFGNVLYSSSSWRDITAFKNIMSELEELTYASTHDIKAPINNISSFVSLLKEDTSITDKNSLEAIQWIESNVNTANNTLRNLISVAKARTVVIDNLEVITIEKIFKEVISLVEGLTENIDVKITNDFTNCETVSFSEVHLKSMLQNLLNNAIKYQSKNRKLEIEVKSYKIRGYNCISVKDNGIGINLKEHKDLVFGLFKRATDHKEGSGLALYLIRKILDKTGGKIEVKSQLGVGSTFILYFKN
ncbi:chemotaxis protein CheB [Polaribacter sp. Asnod6-C07]|uniref:chemotaxis protein CheB n=1 Tax=Polaribacter sp. Asnod6-C07 TaxID=3160582 RepID=UPI0038653383